MHVDPVIAQGTGCIGVIILTHHQAARKYADPAFKDAHIYVHFKAGYTLTLKQGLSKRHCCHIGSAQ